MKAPPLVSILIPCYNSEQWLAESIESALSQTWKNKEIIIVNDGSTDNSLAVAKSFESSIVKVISQENRGASAARNTALKEAQGDFIQYLDADDLLGRDKIAQQIELLEKSPSNYIASGVWGRFFQSPGETGFFLEEPIHQDILSPVDWLLRIYKYGGMVHPGIWLVPRQVTEKAGLWNEELSLNDDGEYFCRAILASNGVVFCNQAKSYYRSCLPNSLSRTKSPAAILSSFKATQLCTEALLGKKNTQDTRKACAIIFQKFIYNTYPNELSLIKEAEKKVNELGGCKGIKPSGGKKFHLFRKFLGWKIARKIQRYFYTIKNINFTSIKTSKI